MAKLRKEFYLQEDVVDLASSLLGKKLCTYIDGIYTAGLITETEAYAGMHDKASHAYNNKRTKRNEVMYHPGGTAYVYLCYGLHHLFNVVTNVQDVPHAILIRAIKPAEGIEHMLVCRKHKSLAKNTTGGPGTLSQALGITTRLNGTDLTEKSIWIEDTGIIFTKKQIQITPRIGVDYAGEDAKLPYRFLVKDA